MKRLRLQIWSGTVLSPRTRPPIQSLSSSLCKRCLAQAARSASTISPTIDDTKPPTPPQTNILSEETLLKLPSPPPSAASSSAKLAALHARLSLPTSLPLETLARTLIDYSADPSPRFNNKSLSVLGHDLLTYYTSEYLVAQYPRLPLAVIFAAMYAYVGPKALTAITREWGVDYAAHPGGEVDPGLLQFKRLPPQPLPEEKPLSAGPTPIIHTREDTILNRPKGWRASISARTIYNDEFGEQTKLPFRPDASHPVATPDEKETGVTLEKACTNFIRALMGAIYLHSGRPAAKLFYRNHFMSRQLNMSQLFQFRYPTRDLSRLCAREGFQLPVARILSETGRKSRHPVFIVGVFSGNDKLGEGAGSSLDEARIRAAVAALKGWYLYSPLEFRVPSEMEEEGAGEWKAVLVDSGDIVV